MKGDCVFRNTPELVNGLPSGMIWQCIHCIEDEKQLDKQKCGCLSLVLLTLLKDK